MVKTFTVEDLINELSNYPPTMPVFFYDADKERDSCLQVLELNGPRLEPEDDGLIIPSTPYYCKGVSNIEQYWATHGMTPILCLREKTWQEEMK